MGGGPEDGIVGTCRCASLGLGGGVSGESGCELELCGGTDLEDDSSWLVSSSSS
jgi:hypothetical protein